MVEAAVLIKSEVFRFAVDKTREIGFQKQYIE